MNDDELRDQMRREVPAPRADYWETIDASLADIEAERPATRSPATGPQSISDEQNLNFRDTDPNVIRLTDMHNSSFPIRHSTRALWIGAAASILILLGGVGVVLATGGNAEKSVAADAPELTAETIPESEVASDGSEADTDSSATAGASESSNGEEDSATPATLSDGAPADDEDRNDSDDNENAEPAEPPIYWDFVAGYGINMRAEPSLGGEIVGRWDGTETGIPGTGRSRVVADYEWVEIASDEGRPLGWVGGEFVIESGTSQTYVISDGPPMIWDFVSGAPVNTRAVPGLAGEVVGTWAGDEIGIGGTGRSATVVESEWIELASGEERSSGWVPRDVLAPAYADRLMNCYDRDGDALVLDFSDDAETFTGALRISGSESIYYFAVAGRRNGATNFDVAVQDVGTGEVDLQEWLATPEGMSAGVLTFVDAVECGGAPHTIVELDSIVVSYPDLP